MSNTLSNKRYGRVSMLQNISHEIFVVDNHSVDGSQSMIKELFPGVKLIESKQNLGFGKSK
ncbi:MAG: glycosyltransferase [Saprospiraceae bacterium]|nr:glycosyltransferase [Saprospiraceae bacterium]